MTVSILTKSFTPAEETPLRYSTLSEWLDWQENLHSTSINLGLDRCAKVAEIMGLLSPSYFVISIAGTNGKGSCAVMLESILRLAGYRVGIFTSPHLLRYNERIRINGDEVNDALLCHTFNKIDQLRGEVSLTYFEFGTLAAMDIFQESNLDIAIMEVGLGGRLDAVNMLDADIALISTIDLDHEQWLGKDRNSIGQEKAGIFRSMKPAICADPNPPASIHEAADLVGTRLIQSGIDFYSEIKNDVWSWYSDLSHYEMLPLPGNQLYQVQNAAGVLMAIQALSGQFPVERDVIDECLSKFHMPCQFQLIPGDIAIVLDVAHNRQAAGILANNLSKLIKTGKISAVLGMLMDKNHAAFVNAIYPYIDNWYLTSLDNDRSAKSEELAQVLTLINSECRTLLFDKADEAILQAYSDAEPSDVLLITGSFYTVSTAVACLGLDI